MKYCGYPMIIVSMMYLTSRGRNGVHGKFLVSDRLKLLETRHISISIQGQDYLSISLDHYPSER